MGGSNQSELFNSQSAVREKGKGVVSGGWGGGEKIKLLGVGRLG